MDRPGERPGIRLQQVRGAVAGAVIRHEDMVFAGEVDEDLPDLPEHEPDGFGLVEARYAHVNH